MTITTPPLSEPLPVLYSFRRCPYAIRARLALAVTDKQVQLREIKLADKPKALLHASPKGTVPVLVLSNDHILDESRDIMYWALSQLPPEHPWRATPSLEDTLLEHNDGEFKHWLDRYKYADRHPEHGAPYYRSQAATFLASLERRLTEAPWLAGQHCGALDAAIVPFIRQFAAVDQHWFEQTPYPAVKGWLQHWLKSPLFLGVMAKRLPWKPNDEPLIWPTRPGALAQKVYTFADAEHCSGLQTLT